MSAPILFMLFVMISSAFAQSCCTNCLTLNGVPQYCPNNLGQNGGCSFSGTCQCANGGGACFTSIAACQSDNCPPWNIFRAWSDATACTNARGFSAFKLGGGSCSASSCSAGSSTSVGCSFSAPAGLTGPTFGTITYFQDAQCSTKFVNGLVQSGVADGSCINVGFSQSFSISCSTGTVRTFDNTVCSGTPLTTTSGVFPTTGACAATTGGVNFASLSCPAPITTTTTAAPTATPTTSTTTVTPTSAPESGSCFHNSTVITYANKDYMLNEIRAHPDCSVPHIIHTYGVIVTAKCGDSEKILKLTDGHLVYTQRGLQAAGELKVGLDTLYADLAETVKCQVVSVVKEMQQHDYFGLNCLNSQVLASGLKSSTFEKLHSIPAFWMQVMGRVFGVKRASQVGDYIVELVQKMNLI